MKDTNKFTAEQGSALPMVLMVLVVFSILGGTVAHYISTETSTAKQTQYYLEARYLAEAGVEKAIFDTKKSLQNKGIILLGNYDFATNGFPGGNAINPGNNYSGAVVPSPGLIPSAPITETNLASVISNPTDPGWINGYLDSTSPSNVYTWTNATGNSFSISGHFTWTYTADADNNLVHWQIGGTTGVFGVDSFTGIPDQIFFHRTYIGVGQVILPNKTVTRKILVRANYSFTPGSVPDSPIIVNIEQWADTN